MSESELDRVKGDLAVMQRAIGLQLAFGREMLVFGVVLGVAALAAAAVSLRTDNDWGQLAPLASIMVLGPLALFLRSRGTTDLSPEITVQVVLSVGIYGIVWGAACGYALASFLGPSAGVARTAVFYGISVGLLLAFSLILVRMALKSRERHYCLGLAVSTLLAGMLFPILDRRYSHCFAHCFMAVGYLSGAAIQWVQLRQARVDHAAD